MSERFPKGVNDNQPPSAEVLFRRKYPKVEAVKRLTESNCADVVSALVVTYARETLSEEGARQFDRLERYYSLSSTSELIAFINESLEQLAGKLDDDVRDEVTTRLAAALSQLQGRLYTDAIG